MNSMLNSNKEKNRKRRENILMRKTARGITIVALVIMIVILLILSTISIQALTHTGLFESASKAKLENKRGQILEWLNLRLVDQQALYPLGKSNQIIKATHEEVVKRKSEFKWLQRNKRILL